MQPNSQSSSASTCGEITAVQTKSPESPLESRVFFYPSSSTLFELVSGVMGPEHTAECLEAQERLLKARVQRDSQIPGAEANVELLRRRLEQLR